MIWYKFYLGDYITHTNHLSDAEDLAYRRLMDLYYISEKEIPLDTSLVARKIRLDLDITESVLGEFFVKTENGYFNGRCDSEIRKYQSQVKINQEIGQRGGRPKVVKKQQAAKIETESVTVGNPNQIQIQNNTISSFDDFWRAWPTSKRKVGRAECEKKWIKMGLDKIVDRIISSVNEMKGSEQWTTGFDPSPLTYINQRRWEDSPAPDGDLSRRHGRRVI